MKDSRLPKTSVWGAIQGIRTVVLFTSLLLIGLIGFFGYVTRLQTELVQSAALNSARLYSQALSEFRTLYTSEVVQRVNSQNVEVTHDYRLKEGAIPLPATLSIILGDRIGQHVAGAETRLYSPYPFPWRRKDGGLRDSFAQEAWKTLT